MSGDKEFKWRIFDLIIWRCFSERYYALCLNFICYVNMNLEEIRTQLTLHRYNLVLSFFFPNMEWIHHGCMYSCYSVVNRLWFNDWVCYVFQTWLLQNILKTMNKNILIYFVGLICIEPLGYINIYMCVHYKCHSFISDQTSW